MDRVLLHPWVSRGGNATFLVGAVWFVVQLVIGWSLLTIVSLVLLALGAAMMAPPYVKRWRERGSFTARLRREGRGALKRKREWLNSINHREGCPRNPERLEAFMQTRPDRIEVETIRCLDCGRATYRHGDAPTKPPKPDLEALEAQLEADKQRAESNGGRSVEMQAVTRSVQDELLTIRRAIDDAIEDREPPRRFPADEWHRYKHVFSDPRHGFRDHVRRFARDAYIEADRMNKRAERWQAPLGEKELDELRELRERVTSPIKVMNLVLDTWPIGPTDEAPDELDEWLLEHRKKGLDIRHRAKTWASRELSGKTARWVWWQMGGETDMLVTWVLNLHHRLDRDRPVDLGRFQTEDDERVLVYGDGEVGAAEKARLFSRNLSELTSLLTDQGLLPERAPGQELRDWLVDGFNRGEDMLRESAQLRTPYGESIYFHKAALEWEQGIHALLASRRADLGLLLRSKIDLPDELKPDLKPNERAESHPESVRLMLRRRLYRLEHIIQRSDL